MRKKLVVIIDGELGSLFKKTLKGIFKKGKNPFQIKSFKSFCNAMPFLKKHKPDLIISDLIKYQDDLKGAEAIINGLINKRIDFVLSALNEEDFEKLKSNSLFMEGLPKNFFTTYDQDAHLTQEEVNVIVQDYRNSRFSTFKAEDVVKYFNIGLNIYILISIDSIANDSSILNLFESIDLTSMFI